MGFSLAGPSGFYFNWCGSAQLAPSARPQNIAGEEVEGSGSSEPGAVLPASPRLAAVQESVCRAALNTALAREQEWCGCQGRAEPTQLIRDSRDARAPAIWRGR